MKSIVAWLRGRHGTQGDAVRVAYQHQLNPQTPPGQLILADLARLCHATTVTIEPGDPQMTAFREGQRSVWLHVLSMLALSPSDLLAAQVQQMREIDE